MKIDSMEVDLNTLFDLDFLQGYSAFAKTREQFNTLSKASFETTICMLCESYCKEHNLDVVRVIEKVHDAVKYVNDTYGKF